MNFPELNKKAEEIAIANLKKGFDWQAFLVYSVAIANKERIGRPVDVVPESQTDEGIQDLLNLFVDYINAKKSFYAKAGSAKEVEEKLERLLKQEVKIFNEIRLTCETQGEKEIYQQYMNKIKMG